MEIKSIGESLGKSKDFTEKAKVLHNNLLESEIGLSYISSRGLSNETLEHFMLGYDKERNAISIPHFKRNEVVAIKYRFLEGEQRYGSEKGGMHWVFNEDGINEGRNKQGILIAEGEFDAMSAWQAGIKNVIGCNGKDDRGTWIELVSSIPRIYIAFDNDQSGKDASLKLATRLGVDKCYELGIEDKDLNEFFKNKTMDEYRDVVRKAKPFYSHVFTGLDSIIENLRFKKEETIETDLIPRVKMEKDWLVVVSGVSNVGKTSYTLNIADELTSKGIPTLILPFERGVESVGKRFLQVKFNKTIDDFTYSNDREWKEIIDKCNECPAYLALPKRGEIIDTIIKSKKLFDTRVVIIDHLDYMIRSSQNKEAEIGNTLQELKRIAEENKILMIIVTHIRKVEQPGSSLKRKPSMEDLKGSSSLYQDPECVVMLTRSDDNKLEVNILKNKGDMVNQEFEVNYSTGKINKLNSDFYESNINKSS